MTITYIGHSGFLLEWENCYWLFDYYIGELPSLEIKKQLFVFVSHKHGDHFNPEIFRLSEQYPNTRYVLSSDIRIVKSNMERYGVKEEQLEQIIFVKPHMEYELADTCNNQILLKTLKSTDCGVAFLLTYQDRTIYYAGDLNHWIWKEETKQSNNDMTEKFHREMELLKVIQIDIAFAPLDPRQEEWYGKGLEKLLNTARVSYAFPMHYWDKPEIIQQFKQERGSELNGTVILDVDPPGKKWDL